MEQGNRAPPAEPGKPTKGSARGKAIALLAACGLLAVCALTAIRWREAAAWVRFHWRFESLARNRQGYPQYRHRATTIVLVRVPGGSFSMGRAEGEGYPSPATSEVEHAVTLRAFLISKYEVTQEEWRRVMGDGRAVFRGDRLPADDVSWEDCQRFCSRAGLFLPTEAQWEYACRAGERAALGDQALDGSAWYYNNKASGTKPVGLKDPNGFGLHDLRGNVWEWCEDSYDPGFYTEKAASRLDPVCRSETRRRVIRGGDWLSEPWRCRAANRGWRDLDFRSSQMPWIGRAGGVRTDSTTVGFRVAYPAP